MPLRFAKLLLGGVALVGTTLLHAHSAPGSAVLLDFHADRVEVELRLPLSELQYGFRQTLENAPATVVSRFDQKLRDYVRVHINPVAPDGRAWTVEVHALRVALGEQPIDLMVNVTMRPPRGAPARRFTFNYDVISHEVMNHIAFVFVRRDWNHAVFPDQPELLAPMRYFSKSLAIDRTGGSVWVGLRSRLIAGGDYLATHGKLAAVCLMLLLLVLQAGRQITTALRNSRHGWRLA